MCIVVQFKFCLAGIPGGTILIMTLLAPRLTEARWLLVVGIFEVPPSDLSSAIEGSRLFGWYSTLPNNRAGQSYFFFNICSYQDALIRDSTIISFSKIFQAGHLIGPGQNPKKYCLFDYVFCRACLTSERETCFLFI